MPATCVVDGLCTAHSVDMRAGFMPLSLGLEGSILAYYHRSRRWTKLTRHGEFGGRYVIYTRACSVAV